jgi:G6PDH family F420-dependent oxidoreductase
VARLPGTLGLRLVDPRGRRAGDRADRADDLRDLPDPPLQAVVAQKAATVQILSGNRFRLGLGAGEKLNEHVAGKRWPSVGLRHEMLSEAVDVIAALFEGNGNVNYRGKHFDVETAKLWDLPEERVPIGVAVSGQDSCHLAGHKADAMIAVEPKSELVEMFEAAGGDGKPPSARSRSPMTPVAMPRSSAPTTSFGGSGSAGR